MKERPILFNAEMVRAILDERKTQTRRVIKPQPVSKPIPSDYPRDAPAWLGSVPCKEKPGWTQGQAWTCPHGEAGDGLWIKETWMEVDGEIYYRATDPGWDDNEEHVRWRSPRFMSRKFSRIDLEVTKVRVEQIRDISVEDCLAEGISLPVPSGCNAAKLPDDFSDWPDAKRDEWIEGQARATYMTRCADAQNHIDAFRDLWDSINSKPRPVLVKKKIVGYVSYPWEDTQETREHRGKPWRVHGNPWVWAVGFEVAT